ncbi:zinc finger protein 436-like [Anopheles moucheti]|uniref:zinc finger protein 436-like n=1 Tax=Anopheles moucheti TaxID=186751 RepID=UPI0022F12088|nr:zinc finger protein 436-like [Anopheles moucheti]
MGRKCCVPNCCSNYDTVIKRGLPSISTFQFPADPYLLDCWKKAINRPNWIPSKRSSICINHFSPEHIERFDKPARLKPGAVPSLFPKVQFESENKINRQSYTSEEILVDKSQPDDVSETRKGLCTDTKLNVELRMDDCIENFESFKAEVSEKVQDKAWVIVCRPNVVHLFSIHDIDDRCAISINASMKIYNSLTMRIFINEEEQTDAQLGTEKNLSAWSQLNTIIACIKTSSFEELNTAFTEECLNVENYETVFLEEHLEETEHEDEPRVETTIELTIEKPSPEANSHHELDKLDTGPIASGSRNLAYRTSVLKAVQDLQAVRNKCFICNTEYETAEELEYHMPTHLTLLPYHCISCIHEEVIVRTLSSLNKHHLMHQKPLKCRTCDKRFTTYGSRRLHEDLKHGKHDATFRCDVCQKELPSRRSLQYHRKHHECPDSLRCKICQRTLSSTYEVKLHMRTHTGEKPNRCIFCDVSFNRKSNLTEHVRRCHSQERPFICEKCGKRFTTHLGLKKHAVLHSLGQRKSLKVTRLTKEFHCAECDKRFETSIQYHSHKRQHVKRYQCSYCGIRVSQLRDFEDHQNTHTGSRPYECCSCGKKFKTASTYYGHRLTHSVEKKHFCTICNKGFRRLRHVQVHMRTHTGEKPFRCEFCGRNYADKQTYNKHKLTHRPTVGDMLRAKEYNAAAKNVVQEKLNQQESMKLEEVIDAPSSERDFQSELVFSSNNFTSSGASDLEVISSSISYAILNSPCSVVFDTVSQGTYVAELPQLTSSDQDGTLLISADIRNISIGEQ